MQPLPAPRRGPSSTSNAARDQQNIDDTHQQQSNTTNPAPGMDTLGSAHAAQQPESKKKRRHRGGKRKKNRRQSFAAPSEGTDIQSAADGMPDDPLVQIPETERAPFYRMRSNLSDESLESEALLDHRDQLPMRPRANSRLLPGLFNQMQQRSPGHSNPHLPPPIQRRDSGRKRRKSRQGYGLSDDDDDDDERREATDNTPLLAGSLMHKGPGTEGYGLHRPRSHTSTLSSNSRVNKRRTNTMATSFPRFGEDYDVNNPPSVPASPNLDAHPEDVMVANGDFLTRSPNSRRNLAAVNRDALIDIDGDEAKPNSAPPSPRLRPEGLQRARTIQFDAEGDVCFPGDEMSEIVEEELGRTRSSVSRSSRRRRRGEWPQLWTLDEWSREEKEIRDGERRAKKVSEPVLVEGRLRPSKHYWHRTEEDAPYRYTYFCEEFESTIHAQTISELLQPGGNFRELFIPDPPELSDSSDSDEDDGDLLEMNQKSDNEASLLSPRSEQPTSTAVSRLNSVIGDGIKTGSGSASGKNSGGNSGRATPQPQVTPRKGLRPPKPKKYGPRPTFWLDVLSPTDQEMRVLCKAFGIHALTSEDIMLQEAREKVELFRNYYFINYRTFEQDSNSEDYLEPVNMYVCVFHHGIITFHFSQIPHPANVRRRIRQLTDYLILSADWISYAIIDDITDVYHPLVTSIEQEVDDIDDMILNALQRTNELSGKPNTITSTDKSDAGDEPGMSGIDMLRRIGECRKKVMSLYRLLGQKADVIKGFAKRCNEQWEVAPKSEIGLYLGDIQDHIITMSSNLSHYETLLSRAHSNYLAQVNIRMGERQESTADILGKLTVIGTIVLPMNIICGMWGMNVKVPGQEIDNLHWFWAITAGLVIFAVVCFMWCKKVYKIV